MDQRSALTVFSRTSRYFDVFVEYAKGSPEDILVRHGLSTRLSTKSTPGSGCVTGVKAMFSDGISLLLRNRCEDFRRVLPDFVADDNAGSPYCVHIDEHLGGVEGIDLQPARPSQGNSK